MRLSRRLSDWRLYAAIASACIGMMGLLGIINAVQVSSYRSDRIAELERGQRELRGQGSELIDMVQAATEQNEQLIQQVRGLEALVRSMGGDPAVVTTTPRPRGSSASRSTSTTTSPTQPGTPRATTTTRPASPGTSQVTTTTTRPCTVSVLGACI